MNKNQKPKATRLFLSLCAALACTATLWAQANDAKLDSVFAPFVNHLRVAVKDPQVRITWEDIPGFDGGYIIYRSKTEINAANLQKATKVAEVAQGEMFYADIPQETGDYFYTVLAKQKNGTVYQLFIPFRNSTISPVKISIVADEGLLTAEVSGIMAIPGAQSIELSLTSSRNSRTVAIFRSTKIIDGRDALGQASLVYQGNGRLIRYTDYAVPGVSYFYAAIDYEAFQKGQAKVEVGKNALAKSVEIPLPKTFTAKLPDFGKSKTRIMPLPVLTLSDLGGVSNPLDDLPDGPPALDASLTKTLAGLVSGVSEGKPAKKLPELLPSDRLALSPNASAPVVGEEKVLRGILSGPFAAKDYAKSLVQLQSFLALNLGTELKMKGHFYLGQTLYMTGKIGESLLEFLFVEDELGDYARTWVQSALDLSSNW